MNALLPALPYTRALTPDALWTRASWPLEWPVILGVLLMTWLYVRGTRRLWSAAGRGRGLSAKQAALFAAGMLVLVLALLTPLAAMGSSLFSVHMVQHLLLVQVIAPLLVLGKSSVAVAHALPGRGWRLWLQRPSVRRTRRFFTHWVVAWTLHAIAVVGWHIPAAFQWAQRSEVAHALQHACFLGTALLFWHSTGLGRFGLGAAHRSTHLVGALSIFATGVYGAVLGATFTLSKTLLYEQYARRALAWGLLPLEDQRLAGMILWIGGSTLSLLTAIAFIAMVFRASPKPRHPVARS
jgi:putative membrane protein